MNIYTHRETNIRKTWLLFIFFLGFIIGLGWIFSYFFNSQIILIAAIIISILMSFFSYWYSDQLVLKMVKAHPVDLKNHPELYRIIENISIVAGLPMPKVYVIPEASANAFATGRDPKHSVVAVTEGLLQKLDRTELEGVIAHEIAHIGNRDILIGTMAVVLVGFISLLSDIFFRSILFGGRDNNRGSHPLMLLIGIVIAILAPIFAILMKMAISRKREFLADATGALLTRYPEGLALALEKISSDPTPIKSACNTTAHLWVDTPFKGSQRKSFLTHLFMTHPPIEERVRRLRKMGK